MATSTADRAPSATRVGLFRALDNRTCSGCCSCCRRRAAAAVPHLSARPRHLARLHRHQDRPRRRLGRPRELRVPVGRRGHAARALQHALLYGRRQHHQVRARACGSRCCSTSTCRSRRSSAPIVLLPFIVPTALSAIAFWWIYDSQFSIISWVLLQDGLDRPLHRLPRATRGTRASSTIAANIWRGVPFVAITLLAGLQTISPSLLRGGEPRRRVARGSSSAT